MNQGLTMATDELFAGVLPFFHTAESSSFGRAAEQLGVSTAAVSKAVRKLEERLGVKLLVRTSRSVALTPEGAVYLERCREAIASLHAGGELMSQARDQPSGEIRVTLSPILGRQVVPRLPKLAARHPKLEIRMSMSDRLSQLARDRLDLAVRIGGRSDSALVSRRLFAPRWVTVAAPAWVARHGAPASPVALARCNTLRFVGPDGRPRAWTFRNPDTDAVASCDTGGNLRVDNGDHLVDAAIAGLGIAQVLDFMVEGALGDGRLVRLLVPFEAPGPAVHAVSTPERSRTPNVRAFVAFLQEVFGVSGGGLPAP
jgi:LysR family transcriptional regulator for bpeEF and oprC